MRNTIDEKLIHYSKFGNYHVDKKLELFFPHNKIILNKKKSGLFSYQRESQDFSVNHSLALGENLKVEICPILPLNLPEPKTSVLYLDLEESIFVGANMTSKISINYPIEIGVFIKNKVVDYFSCDPSNSRFGLFGTPTEGFFCKYAKVMLDEKPQNPYNSAKVEISIQNNLDTTTKINRIVFDASAQDIHYSEFKVMADPLVMKIIDKKKAIISTSSFDSNFSKSKRIQNKNLEPFIMDEDFT